MSDLGSISHYDVTPSKFQTGREPQYVGPQTAPARPFGQHSFQTGREPQYVGPLPLADVGQTRVAGLFSAWAKNSLKICNPEMDFAIFINKNKVLRNLPVVPNLTCGLSA